MEAGFYGDAVELWWLVSEWVTTMLDFVEDFANVTFGGSGRMRQDTKIIYRHWQQGWVSLLVLHRKVPVFVCFFLYSGQVFGVLSDIFLSQT